MIEFAKEPAVAPASFSVLLVDALADERDLFAKSLRAAGFHVRACGDLQVAFETALETPPHVLVVRVRALLLGRGSRRLISYLKADERTRHIRSIMLTTDAYAGDDAELISGCDRVLLLPVLPDMLIATIIEIMS